METQPFFPQTASKSSLPSRRKRNAQLIRGPAIMEMRWNPTAILIVSTLLALTFAESLSLGSSYNKVTTIPFVGVPK